MSCSVAALGLTAPLYRLSTALCGRRRSARLWILQVSLHSFWSESVQCDNHNHNCGIGQMLLKGAHDKVIVYLAE